MPYTISYALTHQRRVLIAHVDLHEVAAHIFHAHQTTLIRAASYIPTHSMMILKKLSSTPNIFDLQNACDQCKYMLRFLIFSLTVAMMSPSILLKYTAMVSLHRAMTVIMTNKMHTYISCRYFAIVCRATRF
jgi:hypothetical protein